MANNDNKTVHMLLNY